MLVFVGAIDNLADHRLLVQEGIGALIECQFQVLCSTDFGSVVVAIVVGLVAAYERG